MQYCNDNHGVITTCAYGQDLVFWVEQGKKLPSAWVTEYKGGDKTLQKMSYIDPLSILFYEVCFSILYSYGT